jgi:hypothetical protein
MRVRLLLCSLVTVACLLVAFAGSAAAVTGFGISEFKIQAIRGTSEVETPVGSHNFAFVNEPYGSVFTQAGGHPWGLTTTIEFTGENILPTAGATTTNHVPTRDPKDIAVSLPPGLLGDPLAAPRCSLTHVTSSGSEQCAPGTQVGVYLLEDGGGQQLLAPIVNVTPEKGQSAEFALENTVKAVDTPLLTGQLVRTKYGYGFAVTSNEIPLVGLTRAEVTFWGVPADSSHDPMRGRICHSDSATEPMNCEGGGEQAGVGSVPFLTMPTDCAAGPERAIVRADSWEEPGHVSVGGEYEGYAAREATIAGATGCNLLSFAPTVEALPETMGPDEPVGLGVKLKVPLEEQPGSLATPQLRNSTLTLPEGMSISPGAVDGIEACEEFGPHGINITGPESEVKGPNGEWQLAAGHCPAASTLGEAEAYTPFLPIPIKGHVYLAKPGCGGVGQSACTTADAVDGNLYRLYLELGGEGELADTGVHFKVPLETEANPATGQLTTRALGTPQAPFSELRIKLNGGPRAPLDNPAVCGAAYTSADFTPWSAPGTTPEGLATAGTPDATPSSHFTVEGCRYPTPFAPGFSAGTVTPQAGQFSSFTMNLSRGDGEQYVKGIQLHTPPGLLALLSSVKECEEAQADSGQCSEASKIGTTRVASGAGSHPFEIEGSVYLTGPYGGAPFGLSIVTHVTAGPFNLGLVIVRARINIDPENSTATITTDESGPYAVPQIVFGVPVRLQRITVDIDRPGFMFNPTDCAAQQIEAKISGEQGATANVTSPFAVGGCKSLAFAPKFSVSTAAHTSRVLGASLDAKLSFPAGALGNDANVASVKVDLPRQLPSRLTTLQKACPAVTFAADPAACPAGSIVGIARAQTPLLPVGLSGPAYFVSHGGEAFPSLIVVLQGDGVRVDLTGATFIGKGVTSSTFKTVPDVPVGTFELYLPEGKNSALAANGNLCKESAKLKMPTAFVAQNGAVLKQTTKITVTGCPSAKAARFARSRTARSSNERKGGRS